MAFTRQQISEMREAQLQKDVLIPLFKAMKFRGVTSYGGGSLELGKDVVMWKEEQPRERVNYGVVVKAERILPHREFRERHHDTRDVFTHRTDYGK
jgi:hypothetical protein